MKQTLTIVVAAIALSMFGCKKDDKKGGDDDKNPCAAKKNPCANPCAKNPCAGKNPCANPCAGKEDPMAHVPEEGNFAVAKIGHAEPKPNDPAYVVFDKVEVKSVEMKDPKDLTGAKAEIHINLGSLDSGVAKRDGHLKSPDFFDAAKNPMAKVTISDVKKAGDNKYNARAKVEAMGVTQDWPVSFEVVEVMDDGVKIKGSHKFKRSDFKIGEGQAGPADELELDLHLTLTKS